MDEFNANEKINELKLTWFVKGKSLIAYDFDLKEFNKALDFVNKIAAELINEETHPDMIIHKNSHVRLELYNKNKGGFNNKEIELAKRIENIFITNYHTNA